jgi:hypothetical protein
VYTIEHVVALRSKMKAARAALIEVARSLTPEEARRGKPDRMENGEEGFSPLQQLHHLWLAEPLYRDRAIAAVREDRPDFSLLPMQVAPIDFHEIHDHSVEEVLAGLAEERAKTEAFLDTLTLPDFERTGVDPFWGEMTVMQVVRSYYRHDGMHRMQILGLEPEYQPSGFAAQGRAKVFWENIPTDEMRRMTWGDFIKRADELAPFVSRDQ